MAKFRRATRETAAGNIGRLLSGAVGGFQAQQQLNLQRQKLQQAQAKAGQPSALDQIGNLLAMSMVQNNPQLANVLGGGQQAVTPTTQPTTGTQTPTGPVVTQVTGGGVTIQDPAAQAAVAGAKAAATKAASGLSAEAAGRLTMVQQARSDLEGAKDALFDNKGNLKRGLALRSNIPLSDAPIIGRVIPDAIGGDAREVMSRMENAIQAKLRVETGAQANADEIRKVFKTFGIDAIFDSSDSARDRIDRLIDFMDNATVAIDPSGNFTYRTGVEEVDSKLNKPAEVNGGNTLLESMGLNSEEWEIVDG